MRSLLVVRLLSLSNRGFRLHLIRLLETGRPSPETVLDLLIPRSFYIALGLSKHRLGFQVAIMSISPAATAVMVA